MAHCHAGYSPAEARALARRIDRANNRNPVPFQYRVRFRAPADAPFGAWEYLESSPYMPMVFNTRKAAEAAAKDHAQERDISITKTSTEGY